VSVRARIDDALLLWANGRHEGAFLNALIAVVATSRRRFPDRKSVTDRQAFEMFLESTHSVRLSVEYRGESHPIEHILYKWFRCELVHEGSIPLDIKFMPDEEPGTLSVCAGGSPEFVLKSQRDGSINLIEAVRT